MMKRVCDCRSYTGKARRQKADILKVTKATNGWCDYCGHLAPLMNVIKGRVWTHDMKDAMPKQIDGRFTFDEDWLLL